MMPVAVEEIYAAASAAYAEASDHDLYASDDALRAAVDAVVKRFIDPGRVVAYRWTNPITGEAKLLAPTDIAIVLVATEDGAP